MIFAITVTGLMLAVSGESIRIGNPTCGGNAGGARCQFPFSYMGKTYSECTRDGHSSRWCYTMKAGFWGNCDCTQNCGVTLYHHEGVSGFSKSFFQNVPQLGFWHDDTTSSIKVSGAGCEAIVYEHANYQGWSMRLPAGRYNAQELQRMGFRDNVVSSLKVQRVTPEPTPAPTAEPTAAPTAEPTASPTAEPTASPTAEPTSSPTAEPTSSPTAEPTASPTAEPTASPTAEPTASPTAEPTASPTAEPSAMPTPEPTAMPTAAPTSGYHLAPEGAMKCDYGTAVSRDMCEEAANELAAEMNQTPARGLQYQVTTAFISTCSSLSGWAQVPVGCSVQSTGDWAPHWKGEGNAACTHEEKFTNVGYQVVCTNQACGGKNQDQCNGACRWLWNDCREPCSAFPDMHTCGAGCLWNFDEDVCESKCPWETPAALGDFVFKCNDGSTCDGGLSGFDCCTAKGGRKQCPQNYPYMCEEKACAGGDHCCSTFVDCRHAQGLRTCQQSFLSLVEEVFTRWADPAPLLIGVGAGLTSRSSGVAAWVENAAWLESRRPTTLRFKLRHGIKPRRLK